MSSLPAGAQTFLLDFGGNNTTEHGLSPDDPVYYWNNVIPAIGQSDTGHLPNLVTTENIATGIGLAMVRRFNGANEHGTQASTLFPIDATRDSLYGNTELWSGLSDIYPSFRLTGLDPSIAYTFTFYASRTGVGDNRETGYTVEGVSSNFVAFNPANNVSNFVTLDGIKASVAGEIAISLAPTANNNNANHFTYLGVMRVDPVKTCPEFLPILMQDGQVILDWNGSGQLEWAPTLLGPWTPVTPAPTPPYSEPMVPGENRFSRLGCGP